MKKILLKHGIAALAIGAVWLLFYVWAQSIHGGLDSLGDAIIASMFFLMAGAVFLVNLILFIFNVLIFYLPKRGKIIASCVLLALYAAGVVFCIYSAYSFSYGHFFAYLREGEFFAYLHLLMLVVLSVMIVIRTVKLKKIMRK